jgi:predicted helicase
VGTGTFLLGVLRRIAETIDADEGPERTDAIDAAVSRLIAFELQLGPFAVAQLRIIAELVTLTGDVPKLPLRMFVTDTLGNPYVEQEYIFQIHRLIGESRRQANEIKRKERITVVIGNPPYKEKAKGLGGWVEEGDGRSRHCSRPGCRPWRCWAHTQNTSATFTCISGDGQRGRC